MATFVGLDVSINNIIVTSINGVDKNDIAMFLTAQQDIIQEQIIKDKHENKNNNSNNKNNGGNKGESDSSNSIRARLREIVASSK